MTGQGRPVCDCPGPAPATPGAGTRLMPKFQASVDVLRHADTRQMQPDARGRPRFIRRSR